jgi:transketolase
MTIAPNSMPMRDAFIQEIHSRMKARSDIFFLTADFGSPQLDAIQRDFPERFVNVGIAEQNLINLSLGLALEGFSVFAYAIAPFITMRCFEQIRVDLALHSQIRSINVNLIGVGAGMSYDVSGPTHHCLEDLSIMRTLPHLEIHSPSDSVAAVAMVDGALARAVPKYFRFDGKPLPALQETLSSEVLEKGFRILREGRLLLLSTGYMTHKALRIADRLSPGLIGVVDLLTIRPMDTGALVTIMAKSEGVFTLEEGFVGAGGLDAFASQLLREARLFSMPMECFGVEQRYLFEPGGREALHEHIGLSDESLVGRIQEAASRWAKPLPLS